MSTINLADAKVSYEGQELPAINLISKLQMQIHEMACRMAAIADTLGDLQAALLNSTTVEVKLTLSKEDFGRFRALGGMDDNERIRKAVLALIQPDASDIGPVEPTSPATADGPRTAVPPDARISQEQPVAAEPFSRRKLTTTCPVCHYSIDLPESSKDQLSVEVKCENCGAKSLLKSRL
jgi:DNA-directed RNA polymerase subunit RPC12/RpoP